MKLEKVFRKDYLNYLEDVNMEINKPGIYGIFSKDIGEVTLLFDLMNYGFQDQGFIEHERVGYLYTGDIFAYEHANSLKRLLRNTSFNGDRMIELCRNFDIDEHKIYRKLSAGQKILFTTSFVASTDNDYYLFLDPFSHLDSKHIKLVKQLMVDLYESGKTVLVSGHNLIDLESILTDVIMIKNHTIGQCLRIDELSHMTFTHEKKDSIGCRERLNTKSYLHMTDMEYNEVNLKTFYEAYLEDEQ